jgi:hypothetical protein
VPTSSLGGFPLLLDGSNLKLRVLLYPVRKPCYYGGDETHSSIPCRKDGAKAPVLSNGIHFLLFFFLGLQVSFGVFLESSFLAQRIIYHLLFLWKNIIPF